MRKSTHFILGLVLGLLAVSTSAQQDVNVLGGGSPNDVRIVANGKTYMRITRDGAITLENGATLATTSAQTYTPTLTNVTNLDSTTAAVCQYMRVGNVVTVSGSFVADPTATGDTEFRLSLPIASNIGISGEVGGLATVRDVAGEVAAIAGDATNDTADVRWTTTSTAARTYRFTFTYLIS